MKERSLLVFVIAVTVSLLFIASLVVRTFLWQNVTIDAALPSYGVMVIPTYAKLLIIVALYWIAWYFEERGFLLAATVLMTALFMNHLDYSGLIGGSIFIPSAYAPMVKTSYVFSFILMAASIILGFYSYYQLERKAS
ncbi:MAG: hypothetical protein ACLFTZ_05765 [Acholeplasmataceae bacterium]